MDGRSRKRQASDTTLGLTDAPKAKRKKKVEKSSHSADLGGASSSQTSTSKKTKSVVSRPPPALYTPHPSQITESKVSAKSKSSSVASKSTTGAAATKSVKSHTERTSSSSQTSAASNASGVRRGAGSSSKPTRPRRRNHLKPQNGSWKAHIASIMIYRCVGQALAQSFDPRGSIKEFNWDVLTNGLLTPDDLKMIWFFIEREYHDVSLEDVSEDLKPFSRLTMEPFLREEIKEKYKDEVPKPPVSAYLLFCKSKGPKLKEKHPELTRPQMAQTLGKRWKSMDAEKQAKYKQQYAKLREDYTAKLERFYEEHPDARPSAYRSRRRNDSKDIYLTPEEKRLKLLKSECPKPPLSAYMLFCKAKREKVHKKHPKMAAKEVTMKLSKRWKSMEEDEKIKYQRMHLESSSVYKEQLKEFYEKYPDAKELLKRKRKRKDSSSGGSATGAVKSSTRRRDSKDTFYSSDEDRPLVHHAHSSEGTGDREGEISSSDEGSSSEEDQREGEKEGGRSKIKGGRGGKVNNERGAGGRKSESESESESSSSSEEEERGVGGGGGKKLFMGQSRSKEKVISTPAKKSTSATVMSHSSSSPLKTAAAALGSSKATLLSSRSSPSKRPIQSSSSSSESEDSGEETDLSDFM